MSIAVSIIDNIANICASTVVDNEHEQLLQKLLRIYPDLTFTHVLTRGGWHRTGGVVNHEGRRIAANLCEWVETESGGDVNQLIEQYADAGYIATSFIGKTHYFVAQIGDAAQDFVQLEVEELQEVPDYQLINSESLPDDIEEIIDPIEAEKLQAEPIGLPFYVFRRMTSIADFLQVMAENMQERAGQYSLVQRFMQDWDRSSSKEYGRFCHHWVLSLQEYTDAWGEPIMQAKPVSTFVEDVSLMKLNGIHRGSRLAQLIHGFDRDIGYPMAWYFYMLSHSEVPHQLAEAIHKDSMGAYDYLPAMDLKILNDWYVKPYGI